jgi:predicted nucleotidyltransferase
MSQMDLADQLSDGGWQRRLCRDRERAERCQTKAQRVITAAVLERSLALGASAVALTGSTARGRRTAISDLDYHVIGPRPDVSDLSAEVDIVTTAAERFRDRLLDGDDFAQWTLRFGCVLYDTGPMRDGVDLVLGASLWPDPRRKLSRLVEHRRELERLVRVGDEDAANDQLRAMLTTAARGMLLMAGVFPLARDELAGQLESAGYPRLASELRSTIHSKLRLPDISEAMTILDRSLSTPSAPLLA